MLPPGRRARCYPVAERGADSQTSLRATPGRPLRGSLAQDDLGGALAVHAEAAARPLHDRAHGLAHRVEGVHLVELLLGHLAAHGVVVLLQVRDEAQQGALGLVAHLPGQAALLLGRLERNAPVGGRGEGPAGEGRPQEAFARAPGAPEPPGPGVFLAAMGLVLVVPPTLFLSFQELSALFVISSILVPA